MKFEYKTIENDLEYLRQVSKEVDLNNDDYKKDIEKLKEYGGTDDKLLALASIQIGIPKRLVYIRKTDLSNLEDKETDQKKILINPSIIKQEGLTRYWESCASCLDNMGLVERPYKIVVEYYDEDKKKHIDTFEGFSATILCHEIDHLNGILHIDKSIEIKIMNKDDRREFRKTHPYEIIKYI